MINKCPYFSFVMFQFIIKSHFIIANFPERKNIDIRYKSIKPFMMNKFPMRHEIRIYCKGLSKYLMFLDSYGLELLKATISYTISKALFIKRL
jgi:hypothetical protein